VYEKGLAGVSFRDETTRVYPQGELAAHVLGGVNSMRHGIAGVESGLDAEILRAGAAGKPVRLSIDVRFQHALEAELGRAIAAAKAEGGAGVIVSARTGEVLGLASAPSFNPNDPPASDNQRRLNRAAGAVYEMGSSLKPFTVAMGLETGVTRADEVFDLTKTLSVESYEIKDFEGLNRPANLTDALAESSNIMAATIAMRVGSVRQRAALRQLGLYDRAPIQVSESARPLPPQRDDKITNAVLGYGHGMAVSLTSLAGAYTVFANDGRRAPLTLLARENGDPVNYVPVFSKPVTAAVLRMMRQTVVAGTGRRADVPGLEIAGKTGSAEKPNELGVYVPDSLFSSFAAVFPASNPRYIVVLALDKPQRTAETGNMATGGAVAAPAVGAIAARVAALPNVEGPPQ
jgi:cell division protein FtsI (penicillin-binding protein 3)